jgi:predicted CopG family antitoxin
MKTINVTFEDEEYEDLIEIKKDLSWREFIKILITPKKSRR